MSDRSASRSPRRRASRSPSRSPRRAVSRSLTPVRDSRSRSRGRTPVRSVSRSPKRSRSIRSVSRSPPRRRSRSRSADYSRDWRKKLERLIDRGYCHRRDVDSATMDALEDMTEGEAECAVQRFSEANFSRISNKSGFFMGIIRRVKEDGPDKGSGDLDILPRPVRYRLRDLLDDGRLTKEDVDMRMCKTLADMPSDLALEAVDKFAMASLDTVRSKTGFMMGIIKRVQADAYAPRYGGRGGGYDRGYGGGSRYGGGGGHDRGYGGGGYGGGRDRYY
ncbi:hypothetical protein WJX84_003380 [Apatococcus fuscideae]|uniref:Heterogeneous nuclear ribonucleoprotein Q acidic domain-containing protein n=1 Tax=Apatococcus fuscideae TaxID=2026836 RepID=A0AAW1ST25_9CHLO